MKINPEVAKALKEGKPVVALESTIISHGMPYPRNVQTALLVEKTVRDNGAVPATMGIINGEPIVGMTPEEIEEFGKRKGIAKVSKRDFPVIIATKAWGATTVSATILMIYLYDIFPAALDGSNDGYLLTILNNQTNVEAYNDLLLQQHKVAFGEKIDNVQVFEHAARRLITITLSARNSVGFHSQATSVEFIDQEADANAVFDQLVILSRMPF